MGVSGLRRVNHYSAVERIARAGAGAARLPSDLVQEEFEAGTLMTGPDGYAPVATPSRLVQPRRAIRPTRNRVFAEFLLRGFEEPRRRAQFA